MIIWKGYGFLALIFLLMGFLTVNFVFGKEFYNTHNWVHFLGYLIAGALCYFVGRKLNKEKGKVYVDKETGEEFTDKRTHSFFFIKMEYWGFIYPVVGIIELIKGR